MIERLGIALLFVLFLLPSVSFAQDGIVYAKGCFPLYESAGIKSAHLLNQISNGVHYIGYLDITNETNNQATIVYMSRSATESTGKAWTIHSQNVFTYSTCDTEAPKAGLTIINLVVYSLAVFLFIFGFRFGYDYGVAR